MTKDQASLINGNAVLKKNCQEMLQNHNYHDKKAEIN